MNRELKIGDEVMYTDKKSSDYWKKEGYPSIYKKIAKIICVGSNKKNIDYLLEFKKIAKISRYNGNGGNGKNGYCFWCKKHHIQLIIK